MAGYSCRESSILLELVRSNTKFYSLRKRIIGRINYKKNEVIEDTVEGLISKVSDIKLVVASRDSNAGVKTRPLRHAAPSSFWWIKRLGAPRELVEEETTLEIVKLFI
jgi:hypothetical protein